MGSYRKLGKPCLLFAPSDAPFVHIQLLCWPVVILKLTIIIQVTA